MKLLREDAKVGHSRWMPPVAYSAELPSGAGHRVGQVPRVGAHLRVDLLSQLRLLREWISHVGFMRKVVVVGSFVEHRANPW